MHVPIGLEENHQGVVDLGRMEAVTFHGPNGNEIKRGPVPDELASTAAAKRRELLETLAEVDEALGDLFLMGEDPTSEQLAGAIRRATIADFAPRVHGLCVQEQGRAARSWTGSGLPARAARRWRTSLWT